MRRCRAVTSALACVLALGFTASGVAAKNTERVSMTAGEWRIDPDKNTDKGHVQLELRREWRTSKGTGRSIHSFDLPREELVGIEPRDWMASNAPVAFELRRDAGRVRLEGTMRRGRGSGTYSFEPDQAFRSEMERNGFDQVTDDELMRLALHDIGREWFRGFKRRGDRMTLDDIVRFKVHGVTPDYVDGMTVGGYRSLTSDEIVRLKVHGIDPSYVRELSDLGGGRPTPDDLVRLKVHGVDPDYIRQMLALASPKPDVDEMVRMHIHGVQPEFVREMRSAGYASLGAEELVRLRLNGVSASDARRARSQFGEVSVDDLVRLKHRGRI